MPDADAPEHIRLSLPADLDLRPVAEVAVAVVARRMGLPDTEVAAARAAVGDAFTELATAGDDPIEMEVSASDRHLATRLRSGGAERTVTAPRGPTDRPV